MLDTRWTVAGGARSRLGRRTAGAGSAEDAGFPPPAGSGCGGRLRWTAVGGEGRVSPFHSSVYRLSSERLCAGGGPRGLWEPWEPWEPWGLGGVAGGCSGSLPTGARPRGTAHCCCCCSSPPASSIVM